MPIMRSYGNAYYFWKIEQLSPGKWRDLVQDLHEIDGEAQVPLAREILNKGPLLAWCMVFTLARYQETLKRWGTTNELQALTGLLRRRALQVLSRSSSAKGDDYASALMALSFAPRYRDVQLITKTMEAFPKHSDLYDEGASILHSIGLCGAGRPALELLAFLKKELQRIELDFRSQYTFVDMLISQGSKEAEEFVWSYAKTTVFLSRGMIALSALLPVDPQKAIPIAESRLATFQKHSSSPLSEQEGYRKNNFLRALEDAESNLHIQIEGQELQQKLLQILSNKPIQKDQLQKVTEALKENHFEEDSLIKIISMHLGQYEAAVHQILLGLCLALELRWTGARALLHEKVLGCFETEPVLSGTILLKMTEEAEKSPDVKMLLSYFEHISQEEASIAQGLLEPLFWHDTRNFDVLTWALRSPFPALRRNCAELLEYSSNPPQDFDKVIQKIFEKEQEDDIRKALKAYLNQLRKWFRNQGK